MDDIKALFAERRRMALLALAALSAARCAAVQAERAELPEQSAPEGQAPSPAQGEGEERAPSAAQGGEGGTSPSEAERAAIDRLSDEMRARQGEYEAEAEELAATLSANTWAAGNEAATLTFTDRTYTESTPEGGQTHPYVVLATAKQTDTRGLLETTTAAIETDDGTYIMELMRAVSEDGGEVTMGLACDAFEHSGYARAEAAGGLSVSGLNSEVDALLDGQTQLLREQLADFCSQHFPSAAVAAWDGRAEVDYGEGTVRLVFTLDNQAKSRVSATFSPAERTIDVGKAA